MSFDYAAKAATADRLIRKYGSGVVLTRPSSVDPSMDPTTGIVSPQAPATYSGGAGVRDAYASKDIDGTRIRASDFALYLSIVGIPQPQPGDRIGFAGGDYAVIDCKPLQPSVQAVLFQIQCRA